MADSMGDIHRWETSDIPLVLTQELPAGRKVVVEDVEDLAVHSRSQPCQRNGLCAVIDIRERYRVGATQVEKDTERSDSHPAGDVLLAGTIHAPWPDDDVRNPESPAVLDHELILLDLGEAIGVA